MSTVVFQTPGTDPCVVTSKSIRTQSLDFPIYVDDDLINSVVTGQLSLSAPNRLVRSIVSNMVPVCHTVQRSPNRTEVMEVAKVLVGRYDVLGDGPMNRLKPWVSCHVTEFTWFMGKYSEAVSADVSTPMVTNPHFQKVTLYA